MKRKRKEITFTLKSDFPLAGVGRSLTKKEWKRIYGYEVGLTLGAKWVANIESDKDLKLV